MSARTATIRTSPVRTAAVVAAVATAAAGGGLVQSRPGTRTWFRSLRKPALEPPDAVFGPVWTALYAGLAWNGARLFAADRDGTGPGTTRARALWAAQLALNAVWTPIFFGLRRPGWALVDLAALDAVAVALRVEEGRRGEPTAHVLDPYLAWLAFATYLNASVCRLNAGD